VRPARLTAFAVLAAHLGAALALPWLHQRHHARHGADHVHGAGVTIYSPHDEAAHHAAFDTDLAALGLAEVAHAGALEVDCALSPFTLAACESTAAPTHPRSFGDELLARSSPRPLDPGHGRGALEHSGASLLGVAPFVLPPPAQSITRADPRAPVRDLISRPRPAAASRGPPALV
jgi:hypothetical protein